MVYPPFVRHFRVSKGEVNILKKAMPEKSKKEHAPDCTCSLCGQKYKGFSFKSGYVCESCIEYIKDSYTDKEETDTKL